MSFNIKDMCSYVKLAEKLNHSLRISKFGLKLAQKSFFLPFSQTLAISQNGLHGFF